MLDCDSLSTMCHVIVYIGSLSGNATQYGIRYTSYEGIRYAQKLTPESRFMEPYPIHEDVNIGRKVDCLEVNPVNGELVGEEDCLFLNVYVPSNIYHTLPVMIWIHGRGFPLGDNRASVYDPEPLMQHSMIVVTFSYRIGPFAYDHSKNPPYDVGWRDRQMAINWVLKNIHKFGGDPKRVTLAGQSLGAVHALHHVNGYFNGKIKRAIALSAVRFSEWAMTRMRWTMVQTGHIFQKLGCDSTDCLRTKTAEEIVRISYSYNKKYLWPWHDIFMSNWPGLGFKALAEEPWIERKQNANYSLLIGLRRHEGDIINEFAAVYNTSEEDLGRFYCTFSNYAVLPGDHDGDYCYYTPSRHITALYHLDKGPVTRVKEFVEDGWTFFPASIEASLHIGDYEAFMYDYVGCNSSPLCMLQCKVPFMIIRDGCPFDGVSQKPLARKSATVVAKFVHGMELNLSYFLDDNTFFSITEALVNPNAFTYYFISDDLAWRMSTWRRYHWRNLPITWLDMRFDLAKSKNTSEPESQKSTAYFKRQLEKREEVILFLYNCAVKKSKWEKNQAVVIIEELKYFKRELYRLEWEEPDSLLIDFQSTAWFGLEPKKLSDAIEQYIRIMEFFETALRLDVNTEIDLQSSTWVALKNFITKPLNFTESIYPGLEAEISQLIKEPYNPSARTLIENELTFSKIQMQFYQRCSKQLGQDEHREILDILIYRLHRIWDKLGRFNGDKSRVLGKYMRTAIHNARPSMIDANQAFMKLFGVYNEFSNLLANKDENDSDLKLPFWKWLVNFLKEPFYFSSDVTGFKIDLCEFGNSLECLKSQIVKRKKLADSYYKCADLFDLTKQQQVAKYIYGLISQLKKDLNIIDSNMETFNSLHSKRGEDYWFEKSPTVFASFRQYNSLLELFHANLHEGLADSLPPFWDRIRDFATDPFEFSGLLNKKTVKALMEIAESNQTDYYEVPVVAEKMKLYRDIQSRIETVRAYRACTEEFEEDMKFNLTETATLHLNSLKKHVAWNSLKYLLPDVSSFLDKPIYGPSLDTDKIFRSYEAILRFFSRRLQKEDRWSALMENRYWTNTYDFVNQHFY